MWHTINSLVCFQDFTNSPLDEKEEAMDVEGEGMKSGSLLSTRNASVDAIVFY